MTLVRRALPAVLLVAVGIGAVAVVAPWSNDPAEHSSRWARSYRALCTATTSTDYAQARRVFLDDAHDDLHQLAAALGHQDAPLAGRLLEANERVEAELDETTADLSRSMQRLAALTRHAAATVGEPIRVPCSEPDTP